MVAPSDGFNRIPGWPSAADRLLDRGDVDLAHFHHGREGALGGQSAGGHGIGQDARGDLPGHAPLVLAPAAATFLAAVFDDGVPVAVGLLLGVGGDLEGEGLALLELRPAVEAEARDAEDGELNATLSPELLSAAGVTGQRPNRHHDNPQRAAGDVSAFHRQDLAFFARRKVARGLVNSRDPAVRKD